MLVLRGNNLTHLYRDILAGVLQGDTVSPRGMKTREVRGALVALTDPYNNVVVSAARKPNYHFMVAEFLWMLLGQNDAASISRFNKQIGNFSDDGVYFDGAYGPQIAEQMGWAIKTLKTDPFSRQVVMTIWRQRPGPSKDVPCTSLFQFQLRNGGLEMDTWMRSNDVWLGLPYDVFNFTRIQAYVAAQLGVGASVYRHHVGSLHIYEPHFDRALEVIAEEANPRQGLTLGGQSPAFPAEQPVPPLVRAYFNEIAGFSGDMLEAGDLSFKVRDLPRPWNEYLALLLTRVAPHHTVPEPWASFQSVRAVSR
jgi:thymidylate synthase